MKRVLFTALALGLTLAGISLPAEEEPRRLDAELLWELDRLGAPAISPAGDLVVVPVTSYDVEKDESETRLWLLSAASGDLQRPLTVAGQSASNPVFSPDGSQLAFVSSRGEDEAGQIYLLPMTGPGEAARLTDVPTGVSALKWVGDHLYFISSVWPEKSFEQMAEALKADKDAKVSARTW
ncbi:MAG: TolB family protein, partial [Wenzhouxiangellaceae bacterium]